MIPSRKLSEVFVLITPDSEGIQIQWEVVVALPRRRMMILELIDLWPCIKLPGTLWVDPLEDINIKRASDCPHSTLKEKRSKSQDSRCSALP
jgi:hypothetical protein